MTTPQPEQRRIPIAEPPPDQQIREVWRAMFVGDGQVEGTPSVIAALREMGKEIAAIRAEMDANKNRRLTWWHGAGLAAVGAAFSQAVGALVQLSHLGGGK